MESIIIGVLQPISTIFQISKEFSQGLKDALNAEAGNIKVEIISEYIASGDAITVEKAINKLLVFDEADLITGILSNKVTEKIAGKFQDNEKVLLVNNLGGHVPNVSELNKNVLINSPHLWRHAYTMGNWGVKTFGKKGMFVGSVYDAGYSFSHMFYEGMLAAEPTAEWSFSVPPMRNPGELTNMDVIFPLLDQYQPDFIFAAFCGKETTQFLNEMIKRGWHKRTQITGTPYLTAPFSPLDDEITVYTTLPFENAPSMLPEDVFYHLGRQSGSIIAKAARISNGTDLAESIAKQLQLFHLSAEPDSNSRVTVMRNDIGKGETDFSLTKIIDWDTFPLDVEQIRPLTQGVVSGWFNPYLCV